MYKHIRHTALSDNVSALALQIQAVALAYAAHAQSQNWVERTDNNTDDFIQKLWACYAPGRSIDKTKSGVYNNAYCVVGASIIVNDAVECLRKTTVGAVNLLPSYADTYGNALTLRNKSRTISKFHSDTTPSVGAFFYRKSDGSASGHCGIIVGVEHDANSNPTLIRTVESNASLAGAKTQYGFLVVEYTPSSPAWIGNPGAQWEVIHTELMFTATEPIDGCIGKCLGARITVQPPTTPPANPPQASKEPEKMDDSSNTTSRNPQRPDRPPVPPICQEKYIAVSCCDESVKGTQVADYKEAHLRNYRDLRHSAIAVEYVRLEKRAEEPFRMVTDNHGNSYVFAVESHHESYAAPREMGLFGRYPVYIPISRTAMGWTGDNSDHGIMGMIGMWERRGPYTRIRAAQEAFIQFYRLPRVEQRGIRAPDNDMTGWWLEKPSAPGIIGELADILWSNGTEGKISVFYHVMEEIERRSKRNGWTYRETFVFLFTGEPKPWVQSLGNAISVAAPVVIGLLGAGGMTIPTETQKLLTSALPSILQGDFSPSNVGQIVDLGAAVLPQSFQTYAADTKNILVSATSGRGIDAALFNSSADILKRLDSDLGIGLAPTVDVVTQGVRRSVESVELLYSNAAAEIERRAINLRGEVGKIAQSFANASIVRSLSTRIGSAAAFGGNSDSVAQNIINSIVDTNKGFDAYSLTTSPFLRGIFLATDKPSAVGLMPGFSGIAKAVFQIQAFSDTTIRSIADKYAWAAIATGRRVGDEALNRLQMESLMQRAIEFYNNGWAFTLPAIFTGEKRECLEREVKICTGIECCPPKIKSNDGTCYMPSDLPPVTPPKTPPDTPKTPPDTPPNRSVLPPTWGNPPVIDVPPKPPVSLPACIRQTGTEFVYCPPTSCAVRSADVVTARPPIQPFSPVSSTPTVTPITPRTTPVMPVQNSAVVAARPPAQLFSPVPSTPTVTPTTPVRTTPVMPVQNSASNQFLFRQPDLVYAPTLSDGTCYPARVVYHRTPMEVWFAQIGSRWIEIVDCCPAQNDDCCDENRLRMDRIEERISKLYELLMRNEAGEKNSAVDYTALRTELSALRTFVEKQSRSTSTSTAYNDTPLRSELQRLETLITQLQQSRSQQQSAYNDAELRSRTTDLERSVKTLIERLASTSTGERTSYDDSELRSQLARQAAELEKLRDMRYTGPSDDTEIAALRAQVELLQKSVREQSSHSTTDSDAVALEQQLRLLQTNMGIMRSGFEQNIAQLQRESQERPGVATELARLQQQLRTQEQLYTQKISTAQNNTRRAVRQQYSNSPTPPPVLSVGNCTDCPALVETHTRIINRYPQPVNEPCCD